MPPRAPRIASRASLVVAVIALVAACGFPGGEPPGNPVLELTPEDASIRVGGPSVTFTVRNVGTGPVDAFTFGTQVGGPGSVSAQADITDCSATDLEVDETCTVPVTLTGTLASQSSGTLRVSSDTPGTVADQVTFTILPPL